MSKTLIDGFWDDFGKYLDWPPKRHTEPLSESDALFLSGLLADLKRAQIQHNLDLSEAIDMIEAQL